MKVLYNLFLLILVTSCGGGGGGSTADTTDPEPVIDPLSGYMWYLNNTGQEYLNGNQGIAGKDINLSTTHDEATGYGVSVIVSDGRIDLDHPELTDNADTDDYSKNYTLAPPYYGNPTSSDETAAHGTAVSSLILGVKGNIFGGYGVAPRSTLIGYNYLDSDQSTSKAYDQTTSFWSGSVFNYSYGSSTCQVQTGDGFEYSLRLRSGAIDHDHIYVTSAGNDFEASGSNCAGSGTYYGNGNFDQDKSYPWSIVIGATNALGTSSSYSTPSSNIWVSAPGGDTYIGMITADLVGCDAGDSLLAEATEFDNVSSATNENCNFYSGGMGTSYAAPIVTGLVALIREANSALNWRDIKHILATTAVQVDSLNAGSSHPAGASRDLAGHTYQQGWVTNNAGYKFHPWYGFGQVDASAAVTLAKSPTFDMHELISTDSMADENTYVSGTINLAIPDNSAAGETSTINVTSHHISIEHVQIMITINHSYIGDLGIELTSPNGTTTKLMNINSGFVGTTFNNVFLGTNAFYGERSRGNWTVKVIDGAAADTGTIADWSISIIGNRGDDLADTTEPLDPSALTRVGGNLTWTGSASGDVARYELCIFQSVNSATACADGDWRHVRGATTLAINNYIYRGMLYTINSGTSYTARLRAVDTSENQSPNDVTYTWTQP